MSASSRARFLSIRSVSVASLHSVPASPKMLIAGLGVLGGGAVCVRYLRHEIAADIGPQLRRMHGKLDNLVPMITGS